MKRRYVVLTLEEGLEITVIGDYTPSSKEVRYTANGDGIPAMQGSFDITKIDVITGTLVDYTCYIENLIFNHKDIIIMDYLNEMALLKLEEDD